MLGKRSGKEKDGDLGALLFSLHFSIASTVFFSYQVPGKKRNRSKIETGYLTVSTTGSTVRERNTRTG